MLKKNFILYCKCQKALFVIIVLLWIPMNIVKKILTYQTNQYLTYFQINLTRMISVKSIFYQISSKKWKCRLLLL